MPRRWDKSKPPSGPWTLNKDALQAQGLLVWIPINAGASAGRFQYDYAGRKSLHATSGSGLVAGTRNKWGAPGVTTNGSSDYFKTPALGTTFLQTDKWMAFVSGTQKFTWSNWLRGTFAGWEVGEHFTGGKASMILCNSDATAYYGREETTSSADGFPHDYLFVHDGSQSTTSRISLYKDGFSAATTSAAIGGGNPGTLTDNGMSFGRTDGTPANYRTGTIFDLRVYDSIGMAAAIAESISDPATRFELFYPLRSRKWMVSGGGPSAITQADGVATASTLAGSSSAASTLTAAAGAATASSVAGASTVAAAITGAGGAATASTLAGAAVTAAAITAAAGAATASALAASSSAASAITQASGAATASSLAGSSTAVAAITQASGAATASTVSGTAIADAAITQADGAATTSTMTGAGLTPGIAGMTPAAGVATASTMAGASTAAASITQADGAATPSAIAGSSTAVAAITAAAGAATASTMSSSAGSVSSATMTAASGSASASSMAGSAIAASTITSAAGAASVQALAGASTALAAFLAAVGQATAHALADANAIDTNSAWWTFTVAADDLTYSVAADDLTYDVGPDQLSYEIGV